MSRKTTCCASLGFRVLGETKRTYTIFVSIRTAQARGEVLSVRDDVIVTIVQVDDCITQFKHGKVWGSLGGLSGGPVFAWRKMPLLIAEIVGFIYEYQESLDLMLVRSANVVREDGSIRKLGAGEGTVSGMYADRHILISVLGT